LRKIIRLDLSQTRRANFGQARGFIQRETSGQSRVLKFFAQTFDCHCGFAG
jgi:hypothetical protein